MFRPSIPLLLTLTLGFAGGLGASPPDAAAFEGYWSRGLAEITSYRLEQARYGEIHPGQAVLIFVTEDFSRERQVKLDRPEDAGNDRVRVLKLNATKKFSTGVYPYSLMTSVFTGVDDGKTLKLTSSAQEWCGHVFAQLNRRAEGFAVSAHSYFESEGDQNLQLPGVPLEDELWTQLRLDPAKLPTGKLELLPSVFYLRLAHRPFKPYAAEASRVAVADGLSEYRVFYPELQRTLTLRYTSSFPYTIESFEETYVDGWGAGAKQLTTRATRQERLMLDYWRHNQLDDAPLRDKLGLQN